MTNAETAQPIPGNSGAYRYKNLLIQRRKGEYVLCLAGDMGYRPILQYREALINRLGFVLEEEYGVTDMVQKYSCQGFSFTLEYMGYDMDAIFFRVHTEDEEIPQCYLKAAEYLNSLEVSEDG